MATSFGRDISCTTELRTGRFASGVRLVAEAVYRRLTTPRGMLRGGEEEANYGLDVTELLGSVRSAADEAALPGRIRAEVLKDERIETVDVQMTKATAANGTISYVIAIEATTGAGPFSLQVAASDVTVELLGIVEG